MYSNSNNKMQLLNQNLNPKKRKRKKNRMQGINPGCTPRLAASTPAVKATPSLHPNCGATSIAATPTPPKITLGDNLQAPNLTETFKSHLVRLGISNIRARLPSFDEDGGPIPCTENRPFDSSGHVFSSPKRGLLNPINLIASSTRLHPAARPSSKRRTNPETRPPWPPLPKSSR